MPQFNPTHWINLITWLFIILSFVIWFHQTISFPATLRLSLARIFIKDLRPAYKRAGNSDRL